MVFVSLERGMEMVGLLLLLPLLAFANGEEEVRLRLKLQSFRNETLHRLLLAQLQSAGDEDQRVSLDITLSEGRSNSSLHVVTLRAETSVQSPQQSAISNLRARAPGYEPLPGAPGLYKLHERALTWLEARAACAAEGAHLMVPETEAEAQAAGALFARMPSVPNSTGVPYLHIGIGDHGTEGDYVTETGEKLSSLGYSKWHSGQPSGGRQMNGIVIDKKGELYDIDNDAKQAFLCEFRTIH